MCQNALTAVSVSKNSTRNVFFDVYTGVFVIIISIKFDYIRLLFLFNICCNSVQHNSVTLCNRGGAW